jgi:hypothetical protein
MKKKTVYGISLVRLIVGHTDFTPLKSQEFSDPKKHGLVGHQRCLGKKETTLQAWVESSLDLPKSLSK